MHPQCQVYLPQVSRALTAGCELKLVRLKLMDLGQLFGRGISFPPRVGPDGRIVWSEGTVNVRESIQVILLTNLRERVRLPEFGGGLSTFLFEPNNPTTYHLME